MPHLNRSLPVVVSLVLAGTAFTGTTRAACTLPEVIRSAAAHFVPAVYQQGDYQRDAAIVGVWKFEMLSKSTAKNKNPMPDGTLIDFGTQAWHSDGTELLNSGIRNPADGNFCQGVWEQLAPRTFKLHHLPLAWASGAYIGPVKMTMIVTVDEYGDDFHGIFSQTLFQASATAGHEFDESSPVVTVTGTITASRLIP